ncbi:MAG TPA: beta-propeller fold lactonase family protein [Terriglobia bacterium]|nr:beta-propeller fold lactonase family protein [Terriglobia bacterium]
MSLALTAGVLAAVAGWVLSNGGMQRVTESKVIGADRIVAWQRLPEMQGSMCEIMPASMAQAAGAAPAARSGQQPPPHPNPAVQEQVSKRPPLYWVQDPHYAFAGIAVDPIRDEVVLADENVSSLVVYDRMTNTPPTAAMSEPKRVIGGPNAYLEYACSVYVDPVTGDIYGVNNDTMNWMPVFGRDQQGNVAPKRKLQTPHTTFGIAVDETNDDLFLTIQDDHAVVVFSKHAKDEDSPRRILQGRKTMLADPHGIALDTKRNEIIVTNWGTNNDRPPLSEGGGGDARHERKDFPVGRARAFPGSGKIAPPSITFYPKDAQGDTAPLRIIQGPKTQLDWPTAVAVHPDRGEIFVANDTGHSVIVFRVTDSGDVAPLRVIQGPKSMVKNPTGVAVDLKNNELWVANFGNHTATVFPIDANGDVPPKRVIRSGPLSAPSPKLSNAHTVAFDSKRDEILVAN